MASSALNKRTLVFRSYFNIESSMNTVVCHINNTKYKKKLIDVVLSISTRMCQLNSSVWG